MGLGTDNCRYRSCNGWTKDLTTAGTGAATVGLGTAKHDYIIIYIYSSLFLTLRFLLHFLIREVDVDENGKMDVAHLEALVKQDLEQGAE